MRAATDPGWKRQLKRGVYAAARLCPLRPRTALEAAEVCRALVGHGLPATLGKLSKAGDDPLQIVEACLQASDTFKRGGAGRFYLSVKPPALKFNPDHVERIVARARQNGHGVHFDAHGLFFAEQTLKLLQETMERCPCSADGAGDWSFGLTLPSRWKRSVADARWAASKGVRPRVVKGDFPATPADEVEPDQGYLALIDILAGEVAEVAVATHDCVLAREALTRCRSRGSAVQLELFFGLPTGAMLALARELEVPVRFYVPFGDTLLIYLVRDLLANPHKLLRRGAYEIVGSQERKLARIIGAVSG